MGGWINSLPSPLAAVRLRTVASRHDRFPTGVHLPRRAPAEVPAPAAPVVAPLEGVAHDRARHAARALRPLHRRDAHLELFPGAACGLPPEVFQEGVGLQDVGRGARDDHHAGCGPDALGIHGTERGGGPPAQSPPGTAGAPVLPGGTRAPEWGENTRNT